MYNKVTCQGAGQWRWITIDKQRFLAELGRLLSFMSSWDRQATLARYGQLLDEAADPEALLEELGTPTRVAIDLARSYVPTPPPAQAPETAAAAEPAEPVPEQICWELEPEAAEAPAMRRVLRRGALAGYLVPAILIGLPVAVALICLGLPFVLGGGGLVAGAVVQAMTVIRSLALVSDILLTAGAALAVCAVGLVLVWLGLWLAMTLCWLWVDKVLVALGRRLCVKEVPEA